MDHAKEKRIADHIRKGFAERYRSDSTFMKILNRLTDQELVEKARIFHADKVAHATKQTLRVREAKSVAVSR